VPQTRQNRAAARFSLSQDAQITRLTLGQA
jgi:hypothetical protein